MTNGTLLDLLIVVVMALAAYRGWQKGLFGQALELGGGFIGLLIGIALGPQIASLVTDRPGVAGALVSLFVVIALTSLGQALGFVIGHRMGAGLALLRLGPVNAVLGLGFGALITLVSFWVVGSLLVQAPFPPVARAVERSRMMRALNKTLPDPPNVLAYLRQYLNTSGFPQVFAGFPRPVGPPVKLPSNAEARSAVQAAQGSTVRIVATACGGTQLGSGWISAPSRVVTNAHVVAGAESVTVQDEAGDHPGTVVVFDDRTDLAVIAVDGLSGDVLDLDTADYERGTPGATLGYPGTSGGQLVWHRAAVQARFTATGRDIYGRGNATREVYELRSRVRQGDSGGPFVLPGGDVAGVVFAASTTEGDAGYALTGSEVADEVQRGAQASGSVSTGSCTH